MRTPLTALFMLCSLACVALTGVPRASAGACAMPRLHVRIAPPVAHAIPSDQGILVELGTDPQRSIGFGPGAYSGARHLEVTAHLAREGQADIALRVEQLAPSIARLVPASTPAPGRWHVVSEGHDEEVTFGAQPATGEGLAAPQLVSVTRVRQSIPGPRGSDSYTSVTARIRGAISERAAGVVLFGVHNGRERAALTQSRASLASLHTRAGELTLFSSGGRCSASLPGQDPSVQGTVRLAVYDYDGRIGPRSADVTLVVGP